MNGECEICCRSGTEWQGSSGWLSILTGIQHSVLQTAAETLTMAATRRVVQSSSGSSSPSKSRVRAGGPAIGEEAHQSFVSLPVEGGDNTDTTSAAIKPEEVALSSSVLVAAAGPVGQGAAAAHRTADGRNKRKGRSSPASTEANTDAASSSGNRSSKINSRGRAKRARRTGDDDVVVLEADDHLGGASGSASGQGKAVLGPGAKVAVKPEH